MSSLPSTTSQRSKSPTDTRPQAGITLRGYAYSASCAGVAPALLCPVVVGDLAGEVAWQSEWGTSLYGFYTFALDKIVFINPKKYMAKSKFLTILGTVASVTAILMYVSYISTIQGNLNGQKGDWIQPLVAAINCTLWVFYGLLQQPKRDWPIVVANAPGIVFGLAAALTALM